MEDSIVSLQLLIEIMLSSRLTDPHKLIALGRELAFSFGVFPNPVGVGNKKTGVPSTYRPIGASCPQNCPISPYCYARFGPAGLHQERASTRLSSSLFSAAIAVVTAYRGGTLARLHVSGDIYCPGPRGESEEPKTILDTSYIKGLIVLGRLLQAKLGRLTEFAWGYTQAPTKALSPIFGALLEAGFPLLLSERLQLGGAVTWPHDQIQELPPIKSGVKLVLCPAQTRGISCRECMLCPRAFELGLCIVFHPHGPKAKGLTEFKLNVNGMNGPFNVSSEYAL